MSGWWTRRRAAASAAVVTAAMAACTVTQTEAPAPTPAGPPGPSYSACEILGFFPEEGGACPEGTCPADAYDTNGGRLPCCTPPTGGAGVCVGAEPDAETAEASADDGAPPDSAPDAPTTLDSGNADASVADAAADAGASDAPTE